MYSVLAVPQTICYILSTVLGILGPDTDYAGANGIWTTGLTAGRWGTAGWIVTFNWATVMIKQIS